jgi:hypothetical protein
MFHLLNSEPEIRNYTSNITISTDMTTDEENFENNLMPKLIKDYKDAKEEGRAEDDFDMDRVIKHKPEGGLWTRAWEGAALKKNLSYLVNKRLIEETGHGRYRLTELGKSWKEKPKS